MELLRHTNIDFMKYRKFWITVSVILMAVGAVAIVGAFFGFEPLNFGIDFAGGTQMTLRFRQPPHVNELRKLMESAGLGDPLIQSFGDPKINAVMIKTTAAKGKEEDSREHILAALNKKFNQGLAGKPDINVIDATGIAEILLKADPDHVAAQGEAPARTHYLATGEAIVKQRSKDGIFTDLSRLRTVPGVSPAAAAVLQQAAALGDYSVLGTEHVGPQIGRELRAQGFWAVALSLLGMLCYIWFRFELRFGIGAVMASLHDVLVTFGLFAAMRYEFNLTTVAAFLTLIGYSVNDTVVIFDRIRENMRKNRRKPLLETMNESINQTLSRTIMTSGLTLLTCLALLILGGDVLRGFAFVMTIGIVVGTYSSIYIASPFALLWEQLFGTQSKTGKGGGGAVKEAKEMGEPKAPTAEPPAKPRATRPARARR
jgi:preprotein translocase subunit SecF